MKELNFVIFIYYFGSKNGINIISDSEMRMNIVKPFFPNLIFAYL